MVFGIGTSKSLQAPNVDLYGERNLESNMDEYMEPIMGGNVEGDVDGVIDGNTTTENGTGMEQTEETVDSKKEILDFQLANYFRNIDFRSPAVYNNRQKRDSFDDLFLESKHEKFAFLYYVYHPI